MQEQEALFRTLSNREYVSGQIKLLNYKPISKVVLAFYTPTDKAWELQKIHLLSIFVVTDGTCVLVSSCCFNVAIFQGTLIINIFSSSVGCPYRFLCGVSNFLFIFIWFVFLLIGYRSYVCFTDNGAWSGIYIHLKIIFI